MSDLSDIVQVLPGASTRGNMACQVTGITHDSRAVRPGFVFAALRGETLDGSAFIDMAIEKGAVAVLCEAPVLRDVAQIIVPDARAALGPASSAVYGHPGHELALVGITGTNGKTTVTYLVETALRALQVRCGVMGTVAYRFEDFCHEADHTTPEAPVIHATMAEMKTRGATHLIMETSSHGLALRRLDGCAFNVVAFTNLTQDHLDFHKNMPEYGAAKMRLFREAIEATPEAVAVVNVDDSFGVEISQNTRAKVIRISCVPGSDAEIFPLCEPLMDSDGIHAIIVTPVGTLELESPLLGLHNLNNLLVSLGIILALGFDGQRALNALSKFDAIPGRLERVSSKLPFSVLVDYAHTPDALSRILSALLPLTPGRLICMFGCGGDRDPVKRPLMGNAVALGVNIAIVTSDNPRTEVPSQIIDMILPGITQAGMAKISLDNLPFARSGYLVIEDRARAIEAAVRGASPGDTLVLAGKGHEDYQIIGTQKIHFDDREIARNVLRALEEETK